MIKHRILVSLAITITDRREIEEISMAFCFTEPLVANSAALQKRLHFGRTQAGAPTWKRRLYKLELYSGQQPDRLLILFSSGF
jgi:hypothetical protein